MKELTGTVFEIKRFAVHDGPGIRTTLFLKGCPLNCIWCHNPESIAPQPQLACYKDRCINCGECLPVCPGHAHALTKEKHCFDRTKCRGCGACESVCLGNSLRLYGKKIGVETAFRLAVEDRDFHGSEGGVTLSGGEPLLQADFCQALLKALKEDGVNTAVDTCGCVAWKEIEKVMPQTDIFLFDFKHADSIEHRKLTGQGNELIIDNLRRLSDNGAKIEIVIPLVPGFNDSDANLRTTGKLLGKLKIEQAKVLPYHTMARNKYAALEIPDTMPDAAVPKDDTLCRAVAVLSEYGVKAVSANE